MTNRVPSFGLDSQGIATSATLHWNLVTARLYEAALRRGEGKIAKDESTVCYVTGNGLKTTEAIIGLLPKLTAVKADAAQVAAMIR